MGVCVPGGDQDQVGLRQRRRSDRAVRVVRPKQGSRPAAGRAEVPQRVGALRHARERRRVVRGRLRGLRREGPGRSPVPLLPGRELERPRRELPLLQAGEGRRHEEQPLPGIPGGPSVNPGIIGYCPRVTHDPLFLKELLGASRRSQTYWGRAIYVGVMGLIVYQFWSMLTTRMGLISPSAFAQLSRDLFHNFLGFQMLIVSLAAIGSAAERVIREERSKTLGLLLLTPLSARQSTRLNSSHVA